MGDGVPAPLENGWQPSTSRRDTLLRTAVLAHADSYEHVALSRGGRTRRDPDMSLADAGSASPFFNMAVLLQPALGPDLDDAFARVERFYGAGRGGGVLFLSPWPTPLAPRPGWELVGHPPLMLRPPGAPLPPRPPELRVDEAADDELLSSFEAVLVEGYPLDELRPPTPGCIVDGRVLEDGSYRCWVGSVAGRPVAAAAAHIGDDLLVVTWVATLPDCRGRGTGAALTAVAAQEAPKRPAALISSDPGRPVYERLGFLSLLRLTVWLWTSRESVVAPHVD